MGSCGITRKTSNCITFSASAPKVHNNHSSIQQGNSEVADPVERKEESESKLDVKSITDEEKYKDFEEFENEYSGEGIKRQKAYRSNRPFDQLNKLRHEFWCSKKDDRKTWIVIKQACESDQFGAAALLESAGLVPVAGCINHLIDNNDKMYYVPNFCINDPLLKKELNPIDKIKPEIITIRVIDIREPTKQIAIKLQSNTSGLDLKKCYCKVKDIDFEKFKVRAIFLGTEVNDSHLLAEHNIKHNSIVQMIINEIIVNPPEEKEESVKEAVLLPQEETVNLLNQIEESEICSSSCSEYN